MGSHQKQAVLSHVNLINDQLPHGPHLHPNNIYVERKVICYQLEFGKLLADVYTECSRTFLSIYAAAN